MSATGPLTSPKGDEAVSTPHTDRTDQVETVSQGRDSIDSLSEETPLLQRRDADRTGYLEENRRPPGSLSPSVESGRIHSQKARQRWPTIVALAFLTIAVLLTLFFGFAAPSVVEEYARQAALIHIENASVESTTSSGIQARVHADFTLDGTRVQSQSVRDLGRLATWIAREVETEQTEVSVRLPEYGDEIVGTAIVPPMKLNIRNGATNYIDLLIDLVPGDVTSIPIIANDWIDGRLSHLKLEGSASVNVRSGLVRLGSQDIIETILVNGDAVPSAPLINMTKLLVHEIPSTPNEKAMAVDALINLIHDFPLQLTVPQLGFDILVPNCSPGDPYILVADATTSIVELRPHQATEVGIKGLIHALPNELTTICPGKKGSPLDVIVSEYISGEATTIYIRGGEAPNPDTPTWIVDLLKGITLPVPFTGEGFDQLIKNFSMTDVHFSLPNPLAEPGTPETQPTLSAHVKVLINLPEQMNFDVNIPRVRARPDVFYKGDKFGYLDLDDWQNATASRINDTVTGQPCLLVEFDLKNAPLEVTDENVLGAVIQALAFGSEPVELGVTATVDGEIKTTLGSFVIHDIPAEGKVRVKPPLGESLGHFIVPNITNIQVQQTSKSTLSLIITFNVTNPTEYSATIPEIGVMVSFNGTQLAHVVAHDLEVVPGHNSDMKVKLHWNPAGLSGDLGIVAGRSLLSQYVSGFNTTITIQSYEGSIPTLPKLGRALSSIHLDVPVPHLRLPGDDEEQPGDDDDDGDGNSPDRPHFIKDATLHLWTSTAVFTILSPFRESTIYITSIDAKALYNHTEPVGTIRYDLPFVVPPGVSQTPRLPVDMDIGSVGYEALRRALGGTLKLDATAIIGVRLGEYETVITYEGKGIGAHVRI